MYIQKNWDKIKNTIGLSFQIAKAGFKLRNERSRLGVLWYLLEPLCFFMVILLIGGALDQTSILHYPVYLFLGLIMFNFFLSSTNLAVGSMTSGGNLIKSVKIPEEALVISGIFQFIFSHLIEMVIFLGLMIYFGVSIVNLVFYIPIFFLFLLFICGASFVVATLGVFVSDFANIWRVLGRLLWFATPIFYKPPSVLLFHQINYINPMSHFINISREIIIYNRIPNASTLFLMVSLSLLFFLIGWIVFHRYKHKFAELV